MCPCLFHSKIGTFPSNDDARNIRSLARRERVVEDNVSRKLNAELKQFETYTGVYPRLAERA
jgi:hypothetical protein